MHTNTVVVASGVGEVKQEKVHGGAPGEIRTPDLMVRSHSLYPAELRAHEKQFIRHQTELSVVFVFGFSRFCH
jgi:hypothetical protein